MNIPINVADAKFMIKLKHGYAVFTSKEGFEAFLKLIKAEKLN